MIYVFTSRDTPSRSVKDEPDACGFGKEVLAQVCAEFRHVGSTGCRHPHQLTIIVNVNIVWSTFVRVVKKTMDALI